MKTTLWIHSVHGWIRVQVEGQISAMIRREVAVSLFRQIRPWLKQVGGYRTEISHEGTRFGEHPGVAETKANTFSSPQGRVGFEIRLRRLETGRTQAELAKQAGINRCHLSEIERGLVSPHNRTLTALQAALSIPHSDAQHNPGFPRYAFPKTNKPEFGHEAETVIWSDLSGNE